MKLITAAVLLALLSPLVRAQQPAAAQAPWTLRGVVVTSSGVRLARVRVSVTGGLQPESAIFTDERGQFTVSAGDRKTARLTFTKARYAAATVDLRPGDTDQAGKTLRVTLSLGAAISGYVRDQFGDPVQMTVLARLVDSAPPREPIPAIDARHEQLTAITSDLGEFRFFGLRPGKYVITAPRSAQPVTAEVNPPAADDEQTVSVGAGEEIGGIDLTVTMASQLARYPASYRVQPGADSTAVLRGRVLDARGVPIAQALVHAQGPRGLTQGVESDVRGRYVLDRLEPGEYRVEAVKRGFMALAPGQNQSRIDYVLMNRSSDPRKIVAVRSGQTVDAVDLVLTRGASVSGTVVDEFGEPMQGATVAALELRAMRGQTRALQVVSAQGGSVRTDDLGRYRLQGLQPGTYVIRARAGASLTAESGYVALFYPGTPVIDFATPTMLAADGIASRVDFTLLPQPTRRVRGTVADLAGDPPTRSTISLAVHTRSGAIEVDPVRTTMMPDGSFLFDDVLPGDYIVQASATASGGLLGAEVVQQFAEAALTVSGDDPPPVRLTLSEGATLKGRVTFEGIAEHPPLYSGITLTAVPVASERDTTLRFGGAEFVLLSDDTFVYQGLFGRNFLTAQPANADWYLKSITYKGQALADSAFDFGYTGTFRDIDVVVSGAGARVSGRATDDRGAPVRGFSVAIFSTDRSMWTLGSRRLKSRPSNQDGTFRLTGLVPGDYWIVAVDRLEGSDVAGELQNPDVLDALTSHARRITLVEGQTQSVTLPLVRR